MTRTALLVALILAAIAGIAFALHLVYGWRPAPRRWSESNYSDWVWLDRDAPSFEAGWQW